MTAKRVLKWSAGALALTLVALACVAWFTSTNACDQPRAAALAHPMRAVTHCDYGSPDALRIETIERPVPADSELLVHVLAASVNPLDWHFMRGTPYVGRLGMGLRKPSELRLGVDFAGVVEAVGKSVTQFKPGDEVFGGRTGAFAEYVTVSEHHAVALKPTNVTFQQAAAVPIAGVTALQGVRDQAQVQRGQRVLVNGATGGVGPFVVQIAKSYGADVTAVCSGANADLVRSIGADRVIDYKKEDFTKRAERYDVIIDQVGNHSLSELRRVLVPGGRYVMIGGPSSRWVDPIPRIGAMLVTSPFVSQKLKFFLAELTPQDLGVLRDLMQSGKVTPVVDRTYKLSEIRDAVRYVEEGHARAKVVVTME